jgi:UPF0271 protein
MVQEGAIAAIDGETVALPAETICLHSDTPGAVTIAQAIVTALRNHGIQIRSCA